MLRILRSVTVLEKMAFTVTLSRKYRIPVYILPPQNKLCFPPPDPPLSHYVSESCVYYDLGTSTDTSLSPKVYGFTLVFTLGVVYSVSFH